MFKKLRVRYYRFKLKQIHKFMTGIYFPLDYLNNKERKDLDVKVRKLSSKVDYYTMMIKKLSTY